MFTPSNDSPSHVSFMLVFKGHQTEFPTLQSLEKYVEDFEAAFPDFDRSEIKVFRIDVYQYVIQSN